MYNKALHIRSHCYKRHGASLNNIKHIQPLLPVAKKSRRYSWLKQADSNSLQVALQNLDQAFKSFFEKRAKYPRFRREHGSPSSYHCSGLKITADTIRSPKISAIRANIHREIIGKVKSITITRSAAGKYYASILCDNGIETPARPSELSRVMGMDMGLSHYAIMSCGVKVANPRHFINASRNLRRKQKALSRRQKGSANRKKARIRLAALHERVASARADFQHKLCRAIVDENQAIIVGTLKTANMMKNPNLAGATGDAGWHSVITKLEYKAAEKGVHLVKPDQWFASSKSCHCCGYKMPEMPLHKRIWRCPECGVEHDRDINGALSIRQKGIRELTAAGLVVSAHGGQRKSVVQTVAA